MKARDAREVQEPRGKVCQVYRKKWVIHITNITRDKVNGTFATRSRRGRWIFATGDESPRGLGSRQWARADEDARRVVDG